MHTHPASCWFCFSEEPWLIYSLSSEESDFWAPSFPPCLLQVFCCSHFFLPTPLHLKLCSPSCPHTRALVATHPGLLSASSEITAWLKPRRGGCTAQEWLEGYNRIAAKPQEQGQSPEWAVLVPGQWCVHAPAKGVQRTSLNHLLISLAKPFLTIITRVYGIVF